MLSLPAAAPPSVVPLGTLTVCPAASDPDAEPDFAGPGCERVRSYELDPQGRLLWARAEVSLPPALLEADAPIGLFLSGKASAAIVLNGHPLGANGTPGPEAASEVPGRMDAVLFVPREKLTGATETLVLKLSSHHGLLRLNAPIHGLALAEYASPQDVALRAYVPSLLCAGGLLVGLLYFGAVAAAGRDRVGSALLAAMMGFALTELGAETARGVVAYAYPAHDLRLLAILASAAGFGLCLAAWHVRRFASGRRRTALTIIAGATLAGILVMPGFDGKTGLALLVPALGSACLLVPALRTERTARWHLAALLFFAGLVVAAPTRFLDVGLFWMATLLLLFLAVRQANALVREGEARVSAAARASRLEAALAQAEARHAPPVITVTGAGGVERVPADQILRCQAAGDYVELHRLDACPILHAGTLTQLEAALPDLFLRVHRSHLVNLSRVERLERDASGTGTLVVEGGDEVPVSRRIMPRVRSALRG